MAPKYRPGRADDALPSHPKEPYSFNNGLINEGSITEEGVRQFTGPLIKIQVSETDTTGTCVVILNDPANTVRETNPVEFEQSDTSGIAIHPPTTHPPTGISGSYSYTFNKDPKHPILISPLIHLKDGTTIRPGSETFDFDRAANVVNVMIADKNATTVTVKVQYDTDVAIGANHGRYKIGAGSFVTFTVLSDQTGSFDVTIVTGVPQAVTIQGQNAAGDWGPPVAILINSADAIGGPSLDVRAVHGSPTTAQSTITWTGSGVLVSFNGGTPTTPGASPWVVTRPGAGANSDAYSFKGTRNGQTVSDTIFVPAIDQSTDTPDIQLVPISSTATTITYNLTVTVPAGAPTAFVTIYGYYCSFVFLSSTYTNTSVAGSYGDGTTRTITVTRPPVGNPTYSGAQAELRVRSTISGGGGEEISRNIIARDGSGANDVTAVIDRVWVSSINPSTEEVTVSWSYTGSIGSGFFQVLRYAVLSSSGDFPDFDPSSSPTVAGTSGGSSLVYTESINLTAPPPQSLALWYAVRTCDVGGTVIAVTQYFKKMYGYTP